MTDERNWHLSKSVPITFILAIIAQTIALIWFVATLRNDVDANRDRLIRNETRVESVETIVQEQAIMLARIDENLKAIREAIERNGKSGKD
jgi:type VI protein secretion system component VasK